MSASAAVYAADSGSPQLTNVAAANTKSVGYSPASQLSAGLTQVVLAQGSAKLENPQGIITHYGYENDVSSPGAPTSPLMVPSGATPSEAQKTEPDKNTYLVLKHQTGADAAYDYGTHFLYQGHENAATVAGKKQGYITRINLDADQAHRVTLLASQDANGAPIATIDGSTWDPFAQRLLLTPENSGPTYAATADYPSKVTDISGALGRGGYEGIQNDGAGNVWIVEDTGGASKPGTTAKIPNSFVYRYVPAHPGDLANGKLQALQVLNGAGTPITVESQTALNAPDQVALHSYGTTFSTRWVTVHDTAVDGSASFAANPLAKAVHATPFKRPENGVFRPGTKFGEFYFTETGDTNATSVENDTAGGWGGLFKIVQSSPSADTGKISVFYKGNQGVTGLDNINFLSRDQLGTVEDAGDTLHSQRNALDSGYSLDVGTDYSVAQNQPVRWLAEGRDPSATIDSATGGFNKNDGDNEITGLLVSNGDPGVDGILGAKSPNLGDGKWRWFYSQQHGDNVAYEVLLAGHGDQNGNNN
ncbi:MAG TPA: alkaline phosphatase PhoX [Gaiellaceae bacterium]|nr:alkaline phosphatase PhoX [Gaiellaceae bacterium]